jgi:hypothetical protein
LSAYVLDDRDGRYSPEFWSSLDRAGVEYRDAGKFTYKGQKFDNFTAIIQMNQPYAGFARAMIESQKYPNLLDEKGQPIPPYDVTAHNLALLTDTKFVEVTAPFNFPKPPDLGIGAGVGSGNTLGRSGVRRKLLYKSYVSSMDEGWTRWVFDNYYSQIQDAIGDTFVYQSVFDKQLREEDLSQTAGVVIFPDQSPNQILNGYAKGSMPEGYTGGVGTKGVENLRKFVEAGGTLIFLNRASDFAIEQFDLPVKDITKNLPRKDFYIPGSILRTELDTTHPIAKKMSKESIAWFENSPVFEIQTNPRELTNNFRVIASYPKNPKDILLSGWALGAEKIAGKAALVEFTVGKGKIILFGFRPQYRGQSVATFPLFFNAIAE